MSDVYGNYGGDGTTCKAAATLGASVCKGCAGKPYGQRGCRAGEEGTAGMRGASASMLRLSVRAGAGDRGWYRP